MNIIAIIEGNIRSALNIRTPIMEYREKNYCMKCPFAFKDKEYTGVCDKQRGCGCPIKAKTSQMREPCPLQFWGGNWFNKDKFERFVKNYRQ